MASTQSHISTSSPAHPLPIDSVLCAGDEGSEVIRLQQLLNEKGANLCVNGHFDKTTTAAVKRFQQTHGLLPNGAADANTCRALLRFEQQTLLTAVAETYNPHESIHQVRTLDWLHHEISVATMVEFTYRWADRQLPPEPLLYPGDRNEHVRAFKQLLYKQDSLVIARHESEIDDNFDSLAQVAVIRFQHQQGLSGDGKVGPLTWRALRCPTKLMPLAKRLNSYRPETHPSQRAALMWLQSQITETVLREFSMRWRRQAL